MCKITSSETYKTLQIIISRDNKTKKIKNSDILGYVMCSTQRLPIIFNIYYDLLFRIECDNKVRRKYLKKI